MDDRDLASQSIKVNHNGQHFEFQIFPEPGGHVLAAKNNRALELSGLLNPVGAVITEAHSALSNLKASGKVELELNVALKTSGSIVFATSSGEAALKVKVTFELQSGEN